MQINSEQNDQHLQSSGNIANVVLSAGQSTCERCQNIKAYHTGLDEYPPCTTLPYCSKGHWFDSPEDIKDDAWADCNDFLPFT